MLNSLCLGHFVQHNHQFGRHLWQTRLVTPTEQIKKEVFFRCSCWLRIGSCVALDRCKSRSECSCPWRQKPRPSSSPIRGGGFRRETSVDSDGGRTSFFREPGRPHPPVETRDRRRSSGHPTWPRTCCTGCDRGCRSMTSGSWRSPRWRSTTGPTRSSWRATATGPTSSGASRASCEYI